MSRKILVPLLAMFMLLNQPQPTYSATLGMRILFAGVASFYAEAFHGRLTASGERFDMNKMTCAHKFLPFGTRLVVQNQENGQTCVVTVNDRGPYHGSRVIDLSKAAAKKIGITGLGKVVCYAEQAVERVADPPLRKLGQIAKSLISFTAPDSDQFDDDDIPGQTSSTVVREYSRKQIARSFIIDETY